MGVRQNAKGTVLVQRINIIDWPGHLFGNAVQSVAATIRSITGMTKKRIWRSGT